MLDPEICKKVRLKPDNLNIIVEEFRNIFDNQDHLWIFGSRVDLHARGGDIDLYIETPETDTDLVYNRKAQFIGALWKKLGEQKIDVVVRITVNKLELPIYNVALKNGVKLA